VWNFPKKFCKFLCGTGKDNRYKKKYAPKLISWCFFFFFFWEISVPQCQKWIWKNGRILPHESRNYRDLTVKTISKQKDKK
jgi:hypothetical protein